jgi:perosamine synthetase
MTDFINQIEPWIDNEEKQQLLRVIESTFVTEHNLTKEFEERIRLLTGSKHAISMTNGTAALFCCLKALGIGPGDEVIVPDMTFIATANAVLMAGATPKFADITAQDLSIDPTQIEKLINSRTKAMMPVHLYGGAPNMTRLKDICTKNGLYMIEDAAQGVGVRYDGKHAGTFGDLGILSFYGNKTITCGEGGIVLTEDDELAASCYRLKNHGRDKKGIFKHSHVGYNFAFTEMQAAIGIAQMNKLDRIIEKKKAIYERYVSELGNISAFKPLAFADNITPVYWFTSFFTPYKLELADYLRENNIQTREFFYPLHKQPCYADLELKPKNYPVSSVAYETGISLPSSYALTTTQQDAVISQIKKFFGV